MNPAQFLNDCSLEITASDLGRLGAARESLVAGTPISITFLPGDDTTALATLAAEVRRFGFTPVPHLAARRIRSGEELRRFLAILTENGCVDRVFLIAGDSSQPLGPYDDALAVIRTGLLSDYGVRQIGITGYPEGHPLIAAGQLARVMRTKLTSIAAAGQTAEIVTQFSFDADAVLEWLIRLRAEEGINAPVRIGVPGPASVQSLLRFAARCGVVASANMLANYGVSLTRLLATATPDLLVSRLSEGLVPAVHGVVKAHLYPFGGIAKAATWAAAVSAAEHMRPISPQEQRGALNR